MWHFLYFLLFDQVLLHELGDEPCPALPKPDHLARAANRVQQSTRPRDPLDLDFDLCHEHIPDGFLKADIKKHGKRHLIFATDQQLTHPKQSKVLVHRWYIQVSQAFVPATVYDQRISAYRRSREASSTGLRIDVWKKEQRLS